MLLKYLFFYILLFQTCYSFPKTKIENGEIQGFYKYSYKGRKYSAFEGIPYAKPPIGALRFKEPIEAENWDGIFVANKTSSCSKTRNEKFSGSEDCLHLNVYIPKETIEFNDNLNVTVQIHGGAFQVGSAPTTCLPDYLMDKDLIVVTLNYRLGALGFLSTEDELIQGNNGLKDQHLALKWVQKNIENFGGNRNSITLTGFSAGAMSVHYHYLSPLSKGLFHRGFSMSGTALNPRALDKKPLEKAQNLAKIIECPFELNEKMVECFMGKSAEEITNTDIEFRPVVEKYGKNIFLPEHPYKVIRDGKILDVPWVSSNVIQEGFGYEALYKIKSALYIYNNWIEESPRILDIINTVSKENLVETVEKLKEYYFGEGKFNESEAQDKLYKLLTDRHFLGPSDLSLRSMAKNMKSPVYYSLSSFLPEDYFQCAGKATAVSHCVDARLLYKWINNPDKLQPNEEKMMFLLTDFIETYVKTGIPKLGENDWLPIDSTKDSLNVLNIKSPFDIQMEEIDELIPRKLWNSLSINENDKLYPN